MLTRHMYTIICRTLVIAGAAIVPTTVVARSFDPTTQVCENLAQNRDAACGLNVPASNNQNVAPDGFIPLPQHWDQYLGAVLPFVQQQFGVLHVEDGTGNRYDVELPNVGGLPTFRVAGLEADREYTLVLKADCGEALTCRAKFTTSDPVPAVETPTLTGLELDLGHTASPTMPYCCRASQTQACQNEGKCYQCWRRAYYPILKSIVEYPGTSHPHDRYRGRLLLANESPTKPWPDAVRGLEEPPKGIQRIVPRKDDRYCVQAQVRSVSNESDALSVDSLCVTGDLPAPPSTPGKNNVPATSCDAATEATAGTATNPNGFLPKWAADLDLDTLTLVIEGYHAEAPRPHREASGDPSEFVFDEQQDTATGSGNDADQVGDHVEDTTQTGGCVAGSQGASSSWSRLLLFLGMALGLFARSSRRGC